MPLDGNSIAGTSANIGENNLLFTYDRILEAGEYLVSGAGAGTWTEDADIDLSTTPQNLAVRADVTIESATDTVFTFTGTDEDSAAMTGAATVTARSPEDQSFEVIPSNAGKKFKTITTVTITGGSNGDRYKVLTLPDTANFTAIVLVRSFNATPGPARRPVSDKFTAKHHSKRVIREDTIAITADYTRRTDGLASIAGRENITIIHRLDQDGGSTIREYRYYKDVDFAAPYDLPAGEDTNAETATEGTFNQQMVFS